MKLSWKWFLEPASCPCFIMRGSYRPVKPWKKKENTNQVKNLHLHHCYSDFFFSNFLYYASDALSALANFFQLLCESSFWTLIFYPCWKSHFQYIGYVTDEIEPSQYIPLCYRAVIAQHSHHLISLLLLINKTFFIFSFFSILRRKYKNHWH